MSCCDGPFGTGGQPLRFSLQHDTFVDGIDLAAPAYASFVSGTMVRLVEQLYKTEVPHFSEFHIIVLLIVLET
jgi:hypothetical protein